jgi:hypothetical protein
MDDPHFDHKSAKRFDRQRASGPFGVDEILPKKIYTHVGEPEAPGFRQKANAAKLLRMEAWARVREHRQAQRQAKQVKGKRENRYVIKVIMR